jgi:hypothetical protein
LSQRGRFANQPQRYWHRGNRTDGVTAASVEGHETQKQTHCIVSSSPGRRAKDLNRHGLARESAKTNPPGEELGIAKRERIYINEAKIMSKGARTIKA